MAHITKLILLKSEAPKDTFTYKASPHDGKHLTENDVNDIIAIHARLNLSIDILSYIYVVEESIIEMILAGIWYGKPNLKNKSK